MLSKLMKYELKATSRLLVPLYLVLLFISLINRFVSIPSSTAGNFRIIDQMLVSIYIILIFVVLVVTGLYMITRFYKNLLTDEGYLMFTLPVKTHELITSKLLITLFWTIISCITVLISLFIAFAAPDTIPLFINGINEAIGELNRQTGGSWILVLGELIIMFLLGITASILMIYVSIALGQLFSKHKIIGSFASYLGIYMGIQFLGMILIFPAGAFISRFPVEASIFPKVIFPIGIGVLALGCACFYLGTNYILKRKLNLE